ncbi:MAG TPA: hypothetical protein VG099_30255 [Gemmataceae bacterium]|jgi:hypothetical protein|nr:hypothetical protein [Gemmataceae bacterium]
MSRITIDEVLRSKLNGLNAEIELCDEAGKTVGHFLPEETYKQLVYAWLNAQISDEELDRRDQEPGGSTLQEIWKRLGRQ